MNQANEIVKTDVIIFGGGIAGLWLANRLTDDGYHVIVIEPHELGGQQTRCSQGIIHGGTKYALNAVLSTEVQAIAQMPERWKACLEGTGEIDLTSTRVLSDAHYMWSSGRLGSKITTFFASKALQAKVSSIPTEQRPPVFQHPNFHGSLYKLNEFVVDVPSLVANLKNQLRQKNAAIIQVPTPFRWQQETNENGQVENILQLRDPRTEKVSLIQAQRYIFAAGENNTTLGKQFNLKSEHICPMQLRPLHMVMAKSNKLPNIYAHCIGQGPKPLLTITTHPCLDGSKVWYLGGLIAEEGVDQDKDTLIQAAKQALKEHLPWLECPPLQWASLRINRAEPHQDSGFKPDNAFVHSHQQVITTWPTKLALAPQLADSVIKELEQQGMIPRCAFSKRLSFPEPAVAPPIWDQLVFTD